MWHHVGNYCAVLGLRSWTCAPARSLSIVSARHLHSALYSSYAQRAGAPFKGDLSSSVADFVAVLNPLVNSVLNHKNTSDP